jgi:hypothetical protein
MGDILGYDGGCNRFSDCRRSGCGLLFDLFLRLYKYRVYIPGPVGTAFLHLGHPLGYACIKTVFHI